MAVPKSLIRKEKKGKADFERSNFSPSLFASVKKTIKLNKSNSSCLPYNKQLIKRA